MSAARAYDAILLDVDGTLVDDAGAIHPRTLAALRAADAAGVIVMIATGRSEAGTLPVLEQLGIERPAVVYNGAGVWCGRTRRMIEERVLSNRSAARVLDWAAQRDLLTVVMQSGVKSALEPRDEIERSALRGMHGLRLLARAELPREYAVRMTVFSREYASSAAFAQEVEQAIDQPLYLTHFPLSHLADHRASTLDVVDIHPPCRGKGEALRVVWEHYGIPAERVVAVGDASNDVPMFELAGLPVAMRTSMPEALAAARRVIGDNAGGAIGELVEELFLGGAQPN